MKKKFFVIAGEASGDLLGSKLIRELKLLLPNSEFIGVGGNLMKEQGLLTIFPMEELSLMGFFEVLPHIPKLLRRIKQTAECIIKENPDFVITIDSPDFCFRVMKRLQKSASEIKAKKVHLIAPSVWAYRAGRAKKISRLYNLLLAILPFEPPYFEKYGLKTVFIGHPITEDAPDLTKKNELNFAFRKKYSLQESDILICVMPGSRCSEAQKIFPEFIGAINLLAKKISNLKVVIPLVSKTKEMVVQMAKNLEVQNFLIEQEEKILALNATNFALAKSGTNTIELSFHKIPMIVAYRFNPITAFFLRLMIKVKFANLINLIMNREVICEMIQENCKAQKISLVFEKLILSKEIAQNQINDSALALKVLGLESKENPMQKAAKEILFQQ